MFAVLWKCNFDGSETDICGMQHIHGPHARFVKSEGTNNNKTGPFSGGSDHSAFFVYVKGESYATGDEAVYVPEYLALPLLCSIVYLLLILIHILVKTDVEISTGCRRPISLGTCILILFPSMSQ